MEIRELAERVLFSSAIEQKLVKADRLEDGRRGDPIATPAQPGRPAELALDGWRSRERVRFADVRNLHTEKERGLVLHFFANHELLALELIALALLKFPEAPAEFRQGLARTLGDEQDHLSLYIERMAEAGVELGQIQVSDFFWRSISTMETPMDFVTRLSLTLEQANLDYAPHYSQLYTRIGDAETAALMARIYRDEIRHVRHGLNWFDTWRDPGESAWAAYKSALVIPLTPNRAKGIGFNREGRRLAGFSDDFITELELYSYSKGRCPEVYWFNPACDSFAGRDSLGFTPSKLVRAMTADLSAVPMFLSAPDDTVLVARRPSTPFLARLSGAGLVIPEFLEVDESMSAAAGSAGHARSGAGSGDEGARPSVEDALTGRSVNRLRPWGWSPDSVCKLSPLFPHLPVGVRESANRRWWNSGIRDLYSKAWSVELLRRFLRLREDDRDWLCDESVVGRACGTRAEVAAAMARIEADGFDRVLVKAAFGAAGQNQTRLLASAGLDGAPDGSYGRKLRAVERLIQEQGCVVVEPLLDKLIDLSVQLEIDENGGARLLGITRFITDGRGQYLGSFVHGMVAGLEEKTRRFLYGDGRDSRRLGKLFQQVADVLAAGARESGFAGPVGVDALVYRGEAGLRMKPVVEVNPRFTMGRVALELARRVNAARTTLWLTLRVADMRAAGFEDASAFAAEMERRAPLSLTSGDELISTGVLFTTDPAQATAFVTVLVVAESLERCKGYFEGFEGRLREWTRHC
jgi:uncharacterized ferritin-like protein (DUF455 family)